ncbi:hypothetical protein [Mycoplasmopsis agassizii]|uniref:hypothetical protein n=1 Tax=Mycoplasmopsis agassizii TaxID=33922 RepID=UPI0009D79F98|nr:hypothetical protein [Mycoplasmopsis agassizii]SMC16184.1 hypothetical protein SAMN02745179_00238 [Mycoplasmopsis agassizii]
MDQFKVFVKYNDQNEKQKISWRDLIGFILFPLVTSSALVWGFEFTFSIEVANLLTTFFSIIFTVLFGVSSVLLVRTNSNNKIERKAIMETFTSVVNAMLLLIFSTVLLVVYVSQYGQVIINKIISNIVISFSITSLLLILLATKRIYISFKESNT